MEPAAGAASDSNWNSYNSSVPTEDPEIMALLFGNAPFSDEAQREEMTSIYWSEHEVVSPYFSCNDVNSNVYYMPQGCGVGVGGSSQHFIPPCDIGSYYLSDLNAAGQAGNAGGGVMPMDFFTMEDERSNNAPSPQVVVSENLFGGAAACFAEEMCDGSPRDPSIITSELISIPDQKPPPKRRPPVAEVLDKPAAKNGCPSKKKPKVPANTVKSGKCSQPKRGQKGVKITEAEESNNNSTLMRQATGSYCSDDDSSGSLETNGEVEPSESKSLSTKTRAGRGSATDPQSLYARKRRERINERLRILQNLVPNGTKVDISTMLEEAVQYVKFLQLQIKLLSSDDLWMYAPIAYNGMDIGLDLKISLPQ